LPPGDLNAAALDALAARFAEAHQRAYGFTAEDDPVEMVTFRAEATGLVPKARFTAGGDAGPDASAAVMAHRDVWMPELSGFVSCPVYARDVLRAGNRFTGPAIVEQMDATTLVPPGWSARVEPFGNLILEIA